MAGTPRGFRDILTDEALARERISDTVRATFSARGYLPVETPLMEDRAELERGGRIKGSPFHVFDSDGHMLMLRPDVTLPVARLAASRIATGELPARLRYAAPVVREQASLRGQPRQFTQLGVEHIGLDGAAAEVEVLTLLAESLDALGIEGWHVIMGSVVPLKALLEAHVPTTAFREQALALVHESNFVALDELVASAGLDATIAKAISRLPRICGGVSAIDEMDELLEAADVPLESRGTVELRDLVATLPEAVVRDHIALDLSIINSFDYYTSIVFKAYVDGVAAGVGSGGRYDAVLANMGMDNVAACGFALSLERLQEALGERGASGIAVPVQGGTRPMRVAVPKGSLFKDSVRVLEAAGLPVDELREPGRRLIIPAGDVEYIIVRAQDAPAFVALGGADCGICGSDSIFEANVDLLTLVDLAYGACRFVVAEPADAQGAAERAYAWRGSERVATKYPRITQAYYDRIGRQVEIVALHGNIELGPIVRIADRIVDITATGTTLRENDLVVVGDVMECTARFFAGPAAYRCDSRVRDLASRLESVSKGDIQ